MKAYFILNSQAKLLANRPILREADFIVCDHGQDPAYVRSVVGNGPQLYVYFNLDAVAMQGPNNPNFEALRTAMMPFAYRPNLFDPPYPDPLIKPSFQAADAYAWYIVQYLTRTPGWDGVYLDQAFVKKPARFVELEMPTYLPGRTPEWAADEVRDRWSAYSRQIVARLRSRYIGLMLNCNGDWNVSDDAGIIICGEGNHGDQYGVIQRLAMHSSDLAVLWFGLQSVHESEWLIAGHLLEDMDEPVE